MPTWNHILLILGAYLLGSFPTGYLVARTRGIDIRKAGSGNIGATNVLRVLGKGPGVFVLLMDALKGALAVRLLPLWFGVDGDSVEMERALAAISVLLGHSYSCWLKFKGGKGVATSAGILAAWVPWGFLIAFGVFLLTLACFRIVSLASILAAVALPLATAFTPPDERIQILLTVVMALLVIWRHRSNIQRLLRGQEPRIGTKPPSTNP